MQKGPKQYRCWQCGAKHPRVDMFKSKKLDRYLCHNGCVAGTEAQEPQANETLDGTGS